LTRLREDEIDDDEEEEEEEDPCSSSSSSLEYGWAGPIYFADILNWEDGRME
jgi:hypothetical protein